MLTIAVTLAAGIGAVCRYGLDTWFRTRRPAIPYWGIFVVNVVGSFLVGWLVAMTASLGKEVLVVLGTGFAGGFTTLSAWAWESVALDRRGQRAAAVRYGVGSFVAGLAAVALGFALGSLF